MHRACKPGGLVVFTIAAAHLDKETDMKMGYHEVIHKFMNNGFWKLLAEIRFHKYKGVAIDPS